MPDKAPAKAELKIDDKVMDLPVIVGTEDEHGLDIGKLRAQTGYVTLDPAYMNTASTKSAITFLDGERGILRYRGIPIEELAEKSTFVEVSYLLIYGHLPRQERSSRRSRRTLTRHSMLHEDMKRFYDGYPGTAHPMAILSAMVLSLSSFYPQALDVKNKDEQEATIARLLSKMRTIAAFSYKKSIGQPFVYPKNNLSYCANFLNMMFSVPAEPYEIDEEIVKVLNLLLILHADHEQNCSTSTVRQVGSSQANLFASISAGICALWGPLHGGANEEVLTMLQSIQADGSGPAEVRRPRQEEGLGLQADGLRPPRLQELRPAREDHQGRRRQGHGEDEDARPAARHRQDAGGGGAVRLVLHRAEALPERRLLQRHHLPRARHPDQHVHGDVRHRPHAGLDRALERDDGGPDHEDLPPAANLHGPHADPLRPDGRARK